MTNLKLEDILYGLEFLLISIEKASVSLLLMFPKVFESNWPVL